MYLDLQDVFATDLAITGAATVASSLIDNAGLGTGNVMTAITGNAGKAGFATWGEDMGEGDVPGKPKVRIVVTTTFDTLTSVNFAIQGAPDVTATGTPTSWVTYAQTAEITLAGGGLVSGKVYRLDLPEVNPEGGPLPRFYRVLATITGGTSGAGKISAYVVRDEQSWRAGQYPSNYQVA